ATYNTTFTDVKGNWTQPAATCPSGAAQYASFWVGIDGYKSSSVEQLGTDSDCAGRNKPSYYAWWEMYPAGSNQISGFAVHPGDNMFAEVSVSGSTYTLTLKNLTTGQNFSTNQTQSGLADANAEWIAEAPSICVLVCQVQKLTNFGTVNFSGSSTTGNGHTGAINDTAWSNDSITMVTNGGAVKASPSSLTSNGTAFSVTWHHA
ncbi:MAG TPA: G1 family glutamic endopeptidase, partial [Actinomycetota bacterium]